MFDLDVDMCVICKKHFGTNKPATRLIAPNEGKEIAPLCEAHFQSEMRLFRNSERANTPSWASIHYG